VNVPSGEHLVLVGPDAEVIHVIGDVGPAVRHSRRNDDDVAGLHRLHGAVLDGSRIRRSGQCRHHLVVGGKRPRVRERAAGDQRSGPRQDDVRFGELRVHQPVDRCAGRVSGFRTMQHADGQVVTAHVDDANLLVALCGRDRCQHFLDLSHIDGNRSRRRRLSAQ
jgi:hypothetical protein